MNGQISTGPFPSDRLSVPDPEQLTGLRVNLPKPDCAVFVTDCQEIGLVNELAGSSMDRSTSAR